MTTDLPPLLYAQTTYKIRAAIFKVYNTLGFGHKESVYHKALAHEFQKNKIVFEEEKSLSVTYDKIKVGVYRPDFIIDGKILIELKAVPVLPKQAQTQLTYCLSETRTTSSLII